MRSCSRPRCRLWRAVRCRSSPARPQSASRWPFCRDTIVLRGPKARQAPVVERRQQDSSSGRRRKGVVFEFERPEGRADRAIRWRFPSATAMPTIRAPGRVTRPASQSPSSNHEIDASWSFRNHVQSVLTKAGCNSGACHGAAAGKNGFKLSLRGYDPEADFLTITRQSRRPADRADRSRTQPDPAQADRGGPA